MTISVELTSMDRSSSSTFPTDTPFPLNSSVLCPDWPSVPQTTLIPSLYSIICLLGTFGNALAVCVLAQGSSGRRTVANTFMLNLCVSDLLFLLSLPLWAIYYSLGYHWPFGRLACKLCGALLHLNLYASIFFITAMSVDRYLAIVYPLRSQRAREPFYAQLTCVLVWVLACACTTPILALRDTHHLAEYEVEACVMIYPHQNWFLGLAWMKMLLGFLLPLAVISSCYCAIARHLLGTPGLGEQPADRPQTSRAKAAEPQEAHSRSETRARTPTPSVNPSHGGGRAFEGRGIDSKVVERVLWTVAAVVLAFFLCWFPFHCVTLLHVLQSQDWVAGCWVDWAIHNLTSLTLCLGFSNSAINPVLYCFLGNHFRGRLGVLWKSLCACVRARSEAHAQKRGSFSTRLSSFSRKLSDLKDLGALEIPGPA